MAKAKTSARRSDPNDPRTGYQRAQDLFEAATGDTVVATRVVACPVDGGPMVKEVAKREPENVRVTLTCQDHPEHNEVRYGYYSNEGADT